MSTATFTPETPPAVAMRLRAPEVRAAEPVNLKVPPEMADDLRHLQAGLQVGLSEKEKEKVTLQHVVFEILRVYMADDPYLRELKGNGNGKARRRK